MSVISVLIPSAFHFTISTTSENAGNPTEAAHLTDQQEKSVILAMSHGVAIILLLLYVGYLVFQLFTHADLYADEKGPTKSTAFPDEVANYPSQLKEKIASPMRRRADRSKPSEMVGGGIHHAIAHVHGSSSAIAAPPGMKFDRNGRIISWGPTGRPEGMAQLDLERAEDEEEDEEEPEMSWVAALVAMIIITVLVGVTAEFVSRSDCLSKLRLMIDV